MAEAASSEQGAVQRVLERYDLGLEPYPFQVSECNTLAAFERSGMYWQAGAGKTLGGALLTLYGFLERRATTWICPMPPILIPQMAAFLRSMKRVSDGKAPVVVEYRGTPSERDAMELVGAQYILMSYQIMVRDSEKLLDRLRKVHYGLWADEAHAIKNISTVTHKVFKRLDKGPMVLMTGTPLTSPGDAYAYVSLLVTGVYRNHNQFLRIHVKEEDAYGNAISWQNLDLLKKNMALQTSRVVRREVKAQVPGLVLDRKLYELAPAHMELYRRIVEERLVEMDDGVVIDAITQQKLATTVQQVVVNWGAYAEKEDLRPACMDLIEQTLDEIGTKKLVIGTIFTKTNAYLLKALADYGAVAVYGEMTSKQQQAALHRFKTDPSCRVAMLQFTSAGYGIDGLQHVCSDMLILEAPQAPPQVLQLIARLDRDGQKEPVHCRVAVALGTVQVRKFRVLLENDDTISSVQGDKSSMRDYLLGVDPA